MIRKPNFKLNWKYALGEIVLIFIGISLAIWFNNFNEERKARKSELNILRELRTDIQLAIDELSEDSGVVERAISKTDSVIQLARMTKFDDYSPNWFINQFLENGLPYDVIVGLYSRTTAFQNLKSMGFEILETDEIRLLTVDLFERRLNRIKDWEITLVDMQNDLQKVIQRDFRAYEGSDGELKLAPMNFRYFKENHEFVNMLIRMQSTRKFTLDLFKDFQSEGGRLIRLIDDQLGK